MATINPYRAAGLQYHGWGANVTAICQRNDLKAAAHPWKDFQTQRQTRNEVEHLPWAGYRAKDDEQITITGCGVVNGIGDWRTLDLDQCPTHDPVAAILANLHLPPTYAWVARTGSGNGWHIDVLCAGPIPAGALTQKEREPGVFTAPSKTGDFDHLELRWERCQTIKPPSRHKSGGTYRWQNGEPTEPPARVSIEDLLVAWHAVAQPAPPPATSSRTARAERQPAADDEADRSAIDEIRRRFDLVDYARRNFTGEVEEIGDEVRVHDQGGLLIKPATGQWYCHLASIGGDGLDLAGYKLHGEKWDRTDPKMFVEALQEAARFTNVSLPDRRNGRERVRAETTAHPAAELIAKLEALRPEGGGKPERTMVEAAALALVEKCTELNRAALMQVGSALTALGLSQEFIRNWRAAVAEAKRSSREHPGDRVDVVPYAADERHMYRIIQEALPDGGTQEVWTVLADFTAQITEEGIAEDGSRYFTIAGRNTHRQPFTLEISASDLADDRALLAALTQAAGAQSPVRARMSAHLRPAIQLLSDAPRTTRRFDRTGWADDGKLFLLPGLVSDNVIIHLPRKLPYGLTPAADLNQGLLAFEHLIKALDPKCTTVALAPLLTAPMALPAGWRGERYALFIAGRSGTLKTSWSQTALALYGVGFISDDLILKWGEGGTRNALMRLATQAHDLPFLVDNFKPSTGDGAKGWVNLTHNILEGGEKERMTRASELRDSRSVFCWPIYNGEDVPATDAASLARVLVVPFTWERGQANPNLSAAQHLAPHLPAVGAAWIRWIQTPDCLAIIAQAAAQFEVIRSQWAAQLVACAPNIVNALRVASNLATNQLTWWVLCHHPEIGPIARTYADQHAAGIAAVAAMMAQRTTESLEAQRFIEVLRELLATGRYVLAPKGEHSNESPDRLLGWRDTEGYAYILPQMALEAVLRVLGREGLGAYSNQTLWDQLASLGHLASREPGRHTVAKRVEPGRDTKIRRVLHLKPGVITDLPEEDEEAIDAND